MEEKAKKMGRPPVEEKDRLIQRSWRARASTWARIDEFGNEWARNAIDKAPPPKKKKTPDVK